MARGARCVTFVIAVLVGCVDGAPWATELVDAPGATGEGFGDPARATNGIRGAGTGAGSLDVYSLDYATRRSLTLGFARPVIDGPGPDLVVFENPFVAADGSRFMDPTVVEVSADGQSFVAFPHDYLADDETVYVPRAELWRGFAGITPVQLHVETNPVDPFAAEAGGDAFDLSTLVGPVGETVRARGALYVRLTSAALVENPDTGRPFPRDPVSNGADIDGVVGR